MEPTRVLLISHTCQSQAEGQPKAVELGRFDDVDLRVVVPDRWKHYGKWRPASEALAGRFAYEPSPVRWPWMGPAQSYLHHYPGLAKVMTAFRPHVIDLWEEPWGLVSAQAVRLRDRLLPDTYLISETEQNIDKRLPPPFEAFRSYVLRHADLVVGRNAESLDVVRSKGFRGPAEVVPNAVDISRFMPIDRHACRARFGVSGFVVGYAGRLVESKGIEEILNAMRLVPPDCTLLLAGDGPMRCRIESFAQEHGLTPRVRLLGSVSPDDLAAVMNAMDVLLLPSRTTPRWKEQFGRVIIEAHACATPVIGTDSGAIPEVIGDGGLVVAERNPQALAHAIARMRADPVEATAMGERGRQRAQREFTWAAVAARMRGIYQRLIESGTRAKVTSI